VIGTSRTAEKLERCKEFGLDHTIVVTNPKSFADDVKSFTGGLGVNVILDLVGGAYFPESLRSLAVKGRLMLVGLTAGSKAEFDLGVALAKRATIIGTVLRARSVDEKAELTREFENNVVPLLASDSVKANVDRVFPFAQIREAHEYLESNESFGKVVLEF
jgi:NADPH:quinone reductase-like Zn-dependent oxidoreductase